MNIEVELTTVVNGVPKECRICGVTYSLTNCSTPQVKRSYRNRTSKGNFAFDKSYNTYITKDEVQLVKQVILHVENGYVPTTRALMERTKLPEQRIRAITHTLRNKGMVTSTKNKDMQVVHRWIE